jgi:hypothetical protein
MQGMQEEQKRLKVEKETLETRAADLETVSGLPRPYIRRVRYEARNESSSS